jgi:hypothetical protein
MQITTVALLDMMASVVGGALSSTEIGLYTARASSPQVAADVTPAISITPISVTSWGTERIFEDGSCGYNFVADFIGSNSAANTVLGYYATSTIASVVTLIGWEDFPNPIPMPNSSAQVVVSMPVSLNPTSDFGSATIS